MKKSLKAVALIMALLLVLCGCGTEKKEEKTSQYNYSDGLDENGFWKDIKTADYVTVCDFSTVTVSDEDIEAQIQMMLATEDYMEKVPAARAAEDGDTVRIDYVGSIDGVEFDGGSTQGQGTDVTIGVTSYIDDFLYQVIGHMPGDEFDIEVTFPENYGNEDLNGKDAVFKTKLLYVYDYRQRDLTDAFVSEFFSDNGWETVDDLYEGVRGYLAEDYIYNNSTFADKMPDIIIDQYVGRVKYETELNATNYGMEADDYVSAMYGGYGFSTLGDFLEYNEYYAVETAKTYVLYQAIAEAQGMKVTDDDIQAYFEANGMTEDSESVIEYYGKPFVKNALLYQKVAEYIYTL